MLQPLSSPDLSEPQRPKAAVEGAVSPRYNLARLLMLRLRYDQVHLIYASHEEIYENQVGVASLAALLISQVVAVEVGKPSKTSISTTARRALAARDYDPRVRNPDWLAEAFLGPTEREILADDPVIKNLELDYREAIKDPGIVVGQHLIRTRFFDERLQRALSGGVAQVVILGAGYDSRAYRMRQLLKDVKVFEVDYGPTQEYKKLRVQEILGCLPSHVTYVSIDFTREKLEDGSSKQAIGRIE